VSLCLLLLACLLGLSLAACGGGGDGTNAAVNRSELKNCLSDAGLAPADTGRFIFSVGSSGGSVEIEAIGIRLSNGDKALVWPAPDDSLADVAHARQATMRYTWKHSAYSRFTFTPWTRARFQTYSGSA